MPPEKEKPNSSAESSSHSTGWFRPMANHLTQLLNTEIFPARRPHKEKGKNGKDNASSKQDEGNSGQDQQKVSAIREVESYASQRYALDTAKNPMSALSSASAASKETDQNFNADRIARLMMQDALREGTSDIHLEPYGTGLHVRMRLDGVLHDTTVLSHAQGDKLIRFFKSLAGMDPVATFVPHDGRAQYEVDGKLLNLRLATAPCWSGEKLAIRLLNPDTFGHNIQSLGLKPESLKVIEDWLKEADGMCLVTGPTGSGKTTTLYSMLHELRKHNCSIVTIEDPVEYQIDGTSQMQVDLNHGLTFAEGLKSMLRLDPDYLLLGEIRGDETAQIAMEAATSGRTLMSTLHSRDTAGLISALRNWDIQDHEIAASLELVVAQRLVRKLCKSCCQEVTPDVSDKAWLKSLGFRVPRKIFKPKGCSECLNTGYHGRTGVFEVWRRNIVSYNQILSHTDEFRLRQSMLDSGFETMLDDAMSKVYDGITSLEETQRMGSHHYYFHVGMMEKEKSAKTSRSIKRKSTVSSRSKTTKTRSSAKK